MKQPEEKIKIHRHRWNKSSKIVEHLKGRRIDSQLWICKCGASKKTLLPLGSANFISPEAADINVVHLAADKAIPEWEELLGAIARGWCHPENAKKVMDEKLALAIGEEVKSFIRNLIKQQRSEVAREINTQLLKAVESGATNTLSMAIKIVKDMEATDDK